MHKIKKYPGPLKGEDLNEHIRNLMTVGALVRAQGMLRPHIYNKMSTATTYPEDYFDDTFLLLERIENIENNLRYEWWKLLSLKSNAIRYCLEPELRQYMTARYRDNYFNKWLKNKRR